MTLVEILKKAGFKGSALSMAYAIVMAESGGRARAHNPNANTGDNSYGLFQINMLGAMGPERRRQYGLSSNEDLFDPLTNARVAYRMSNGGKNWNPWSTYKTGAYRQYYGGSMGATVAGGASGATYSIGTAVPNLSLADMAARFGLSAATVKANKEIANLVKKAVKEGWDGTLFTAKLKNTKWWRTTSDAQRKYFLLRTSDPATYKQKYNQYAFSLNQLAVQVGMKTQMVNGKPTGLLNKAIAYKMRDGWTDARIKAYFGSQVTLIDKNGGMRGEAGEIYDQIFEAAYGNGMIWSPSWFQAEVRRIVSGKASLETTLAVIRREAAAKYSAFANQIRAGQSALDLAQPYVQAVAQLLEIPVTDVDLNNKYVNKAMTAKAAAGKPGTQYPLWQFENDVRSDPLWKKTNNARESMFSVAHQVARDFGLAF